MVILWTYDPAERDAKLANEAVKMSKKGVKHLKVIVEIACATSPHHLMAVRQAYCSLFDSSLEEDIAYTVSLPLRKVKEYCRRSTKNKQLLKYFMQELSHVNMWFLAFEVLRNYFFIGQLSLLFYLELRNWQKMFLSRSMHDVFSITLLCTAILQSLV